MAGHRRPIRFPRALLATLVALLSLAAASPGVASADNSPIVIEQDATPEGDPSSDDDSGTVILPAGPAVDEGSSGPNVRTRTDRQGSDTIPEAPTPTATPTAAEEQGIPRLDDPVLRWLPEIMAASAQWGVPPELIAAVIYVESRGEPGPISPSGARGLMQMMPGGFGNLGIPEYLWHDPATNISTGAHGLYTRMLNQGSWEGAVGAYLGFGCDVWGTCTDVYVRIVFQWAAYYKPIIDNPRQSGFRILPAEWAYGPVAIFQVDGPPPPEEPPDTPTPTPTKTEESDEPTSTPEPGDPTPTPEPTQPGDPEPTAPPTEVPPTEAPPTEAPPTEVPPTPVPTEPPAPPTEAPTEPPPPPDGTAGS